MALIVTLTSTSERLDVLRHTLISLSDQSYKPDRIVVCISKKPYLLDAGIKKLPPWLAAMVEDSAVEINWVENTGPYRKLLPIYRQATADDWIVTCDDDVIYGAHWLSSLVRSGKANPTAIVCGRARRPTKNPWNVRQSYMHWPLVPGGTTGKDLLPLGVAGVLYRKPLLDHCIMFSDDFKRLAPKQDDLWFNLARQVADTDVVVSPEAEKFVYPIETPSTLSVNNARTRSADWDRFLRAVYDRLVYKLKGFMGLSICENDLALKRLDAYRKSLGKPSMTPGAAQL
ncbi:glycosyltransferase [Gilvimarinus sp. F26214L]|uniref:glycosyltransferase n=1 Tax=Gilvimarinus sp. DZF01 TaxID=3461371 RepID=UPI004045A9E1